MGKKHTQEKKNYSRALRIFLLPFHIGTNELELFMYVYNISRNPNTSYSTDTLYKSLFVVVSFRLSMCRRKKASVHIHTHIHTHTHICTRSICTVQYIRCRRSTKEHFHQIHSHINTRIYICTTKIGIGDDDDDDADFCISPTPFVKSRQTNTCTCFRILMCSHAHPPTRRRISPKRQRMK